MTKTLFEKVHALASQLKTQTVPIEAWGGEIVVVCEQPTETRGRLEYLQQKCMGLTAQQVQQSIITQQETENDLWLFRSEVIRLCVTEPNGEPFIPPGPIVIDNHTLESDADKLQLIGEKWGCQGVEEMIDAALEINGFKTKSSIAKHMRDGFNPPKTDEDREKN